MLLKSSIKPLSSLINYAKRTKNKITVYFFKKPLDFANLFRIIGIVEKVLLKSSIKPLSSLINYAKRTKNKITVYFFKKPLDFANLFRIIGIVEKQKRYPQKG